MHLDYPKKSNGMPILSREKIENIAEQLLNEFSPQNLLCPTALNTTNFLTNYLELKIKNKYIGSIEVPILGLTVLGDEEIIPSLDAMLRPTILIETFGTVLISTTLSGTNNRARRKYTEMHEGAHKILHSDYYYNLQYNSQGNKNKLYVACRSVEAYKSKRETDKDWMEWQADSLAASLLMPKDVFSCVAKTAIINAGIRRGYLIVGNNEDKKQFLKIIEEVSSTFSVSHRAAQIRMLHLGLIKPSRF